MFKHKKLFLSSFSLRIIGLLTVLIDHIALLLVPQTTLLYTMMRIIGRLAFPLFAFFIVEGVFHSKQQNKYLLRLLYLYIAIQVFIIGLYFYDASMVLYNIFATLGASAALLIYLEKKDWRKVYYLIPITLLLVINIVTDHTSFQAFALFKGDYGLYGIALILTMYFAHKLIAKLIIKYPNIDEESSRDQTLYNSSASLALVFITFLWYVFSAYSITKIDANFQSFSLLLIPFLMVYNGTLGYTSRGWRTFYYLFFPIHIILLALISIIV